MEFLRYMVSAKEITMGTRHIQAILEFPQPKNVREDQSYFRLVNYFRKFIKNHALKIKPFTVLTHKNAEFYFNTDCINAFKSLKKELTSAPVLHIYNLTAETELHTDASLQGFGTILLQKQNNKMWAPIAYFSKATTNAEKRYRSYELETLAIVKAIERFYVYLQGIAFRIVTDCNSLVYLQ